jgi:hypothetical protein
VRLPQPSSELRRPAAGSGHRERSLDRQRPTERPLTELPEWTLAELAERTDPELLRGERRLARPPAETLTDRLAK